MADVRIVVDTSVGKSAEFNVEDVIVDSSGNVDRTRAALDEAYRQACAWIDSLRGRRG